VVFPPLDGTLSTARTATFTNTATDKGRLLLERRATDQTRTSNRARSSPAATLRVLDHQAACAALLPTSVAEYCVTARDGLAQVRAGRESDGLAEAW
jgi:hypothetical protein